MTMSTRQSSDLPPKRQGKAVRHDVSKPLQHVSLSRVVNLLSMFAVLFIAFQAYRLFQWKTEVGGWWNLALGKRPPQMNMQPGANPPRAHWDGSGSKQDVELESHIHAVASVLGMQPTDLASVLSEAVHQHVAPKTISSLSSSVSSSASSGHTSAPAASILFDNPEDTTERKSASDSERVTGMAGTVARAVEAVAGFDEAVVAD